MRFGWVSALIAGVMVACLFGCSASARAATDPVTSSGDAGSGTLREIVATAGNGDTIVFDASLDGQTIHLTTGAIAIDKNLTIEGPGASELTIDAGHNSQIFTVSAGNLSISGLTLANGAASSNGGAIDDTGAGSLAVSECRFIGNTAGGAGGSGAYSGRGQGGAIRYEGEASLAVEDSSFEGNTAGGAGGEGESSGGGSGGAIYIATHSLSTSITGSEFIGNEAGGDGGIGFDSGFGGGGAISHGSGGTLMIVGSIFTGNTVGGKGGTGGNGGAGSGGAIVNNSGVLAVFDSTFNGNTVGGEGGTGPGSGDGLGGAIYTGFHTPTITGSTFNGNTTGGPGGAGAKGGNGRGGAIYASSSSLSVSNSTLVGNQAGGIGTEGSGGAIQLAGQSSATLASVTISGNSVGSDGGVGGGINDVEPVGKASAVTAKATIISGNTGASNCNRHVLSSSYSLEGPTSGDTSCGFDLLSADPELGALLNNGGPTKTQALPAGSPAVDAVPVAKCPTKVDQRGEPRPDNGESVCDVGAYELQDPPVAPEITSTATATFKVGKQGSFTVTATGLPAPALSETGALPKGVVFTDHGDGTASLSGTPAAGTGGSYPITIKASNSAPPDAEQSFTLTVQGAQAPPKASIATPVDKATYTKGQVVATSFTCTEGQGGPGIASCVDQNGRPSGAALDTAKTGKHTFTVTATSSDGLSDKAKVTYRVVAPPPAPLAVSIRSGRAFVVGGVAKVRLACSGGVAKDVCRGKLSLMRRGRVLARAGFKIASGQTQLVVLRLNDDGLRSLRRAHRHRLRVTATTSGRSGAHRTILLKLKRQAKGT